MLYEAEESGNTHMAISITINILTQRMVNTSWHSPLTALTSCLNMLGGDMMSPVGRAEKAAEPSASAPYRQESLCPVVTLRHTILEGGEQSKCAKNPINVLQEVFCSAGRGDRGSQFCAYIDCPRLSPLL